MGLSIKYKLFLAFVSAHIIVYATMYALGQMQFERSFLEYVNQVEERAVPTLITGLEDYYEHTGTWSNIAGNVIRWRILIRDIVLRSADTLDIENERHISISRLSGPTMRMLSPDHWFYASRYTPLRPHLLLLDPGLNVLLGDPAALPFTEAHAITVGGELVGYLGFTGQQMLSEEVDILFAEQQQQTIFLFAIVMVVISALVAFPLSGYLVRPIRDMVKGTRALTSGDYSSRLKVRGSDELRELSEGFNTLAKTLDHNRTARRHWIADISHELRTPLSILRGELEAMQDGIRPLTPASMESLHQEVIHLNTLVNDLHELSMSDLGALVYAKETTNLSTILKQALGIHEQLIKEHDIQLSTTFRSLNNDENIEVFGDPSRLKQLFTNLIQNSCRYTDRGGKLSITVTETADITRIEWEDSAPGVSDKDLGKLFTRLYRIESSRNRQQGGSGLGLAICKNIVEAHEGCISAGHSELGGLKLVIELPRMQVSKS